MKGDNKLSLNLSRRDFLKKLGLTAGAITFSPMLKAKSASSQTLPVKVCLIKNGDCFQNVSKLFEMINIEKYVSKDDIVILKGNAQWPMQGYTHTGVIKAVADHILNIPGFNGEILICDNIQNGGAEGKYGFDATPDMRAKNWPDHNWNSLAEEYQSAGKPVSVKKWINSEITISGPQDGEGWIREFFEFHDFNSYLSYPVFESPLTPGRMIDMKNGVWENGAYTGRKVKAIFIPTLNNHGYGSEDYSGVTSAIKSFFGATEIHYEPGGNYNGYLNIHASSFSKGRADYAGELAARFIKNLYSPVLYITAAMWSGHYSRTGGATETKTILACENPATLDYVSCRDVISPYAPFLNPDEDNNTRKQILGCISGGIGTINPDEFEIIEYDFLNPKINRTDIDRKINDYKEGNATQQEVKDLIEEYIKGSNQK